MITCLIIHDKEIELRNMDRNMTFRMELAILQVIAPINFS